MLLEKVNSPDDLRKLSLGELAQFCGELRRFIIESCARRPGHLASSLGAVELAVALHYVYDTPQDKIIWDVGHQAYAHKIITGRRDAFGSLRQMGGIAGFPRPEESPFDAFIGGHSSNSISAALGFSVANKLEGSDGRVVAVIGDGAMTGGLAFEGMNNAGVSGSDILVVLNDNRISIDRGTGALREYLVGISTSRRYNAFKTWVWTLFRPGSRVHGLLRKAWNGIKHGVLQQSNLFESFGFRYFGPVDGHDVVSLVKILRDLREIKGPKLLHTITVKGKGYTPAELDQPTWHAPGRFDPLTGERSQESRVRSQESDCRVELRSPRNDGGKESSLRGAQQRSGPEPAASAAPQLITHNSSLMTPCLWQDVFGQTILELAESNPLIVAITPAMPTGSSLNLMMERFPARTFDVGIAEGHAVTFAAGLAAAGQVPFCVVYSSFLQRAYDNIIHDVAIEGLGVVLCVDRAGLVGEDGTTHQGVFDLAALLPVPNLVIASPADEVEFRNLMYTASKAGRPFVIRYPRGRATGVEWRNAGFEEIETGKGRTIRRCDGEVAVVTFGPAQVPDGVSHYDLRFAKPLDEELLHRIGKKYKKVITVEDGVIQGGVGMAIEAFMAKNGYTPRIVKLGVPDRFIPHGTVEELRSLCGYDRDGILKMIND